MKKIAGISTSSNERSINKELLESTLKGIANFRKEIFVLDKKVPIYSTDLEETEGIPRAIQELHSSLQEYDAYIIALPEHNGSMTALFKNTIDWLSRHDRNIFGNKPVMLLSTSPGPSGGKYVTKHVKTLLPFLSAKVVSTFSLSNFYDAFQNGDIATDKTQLNESVTTLINAV